MATATKSRFAARCKAFTGEGVREHLIMIDFDNTVLVWDSVAGHFTNCHALSDRQQDRLLRIAGVK